MAGAASLAKQDVQLAVGPVTLGPGEARARSSSWLYFGQSKYE